MSFLHARHRREREKGQGGVGGIGKGEREGGELCPAQIKNTCTRGGRETYERKNHKQKKDKMTKNTQGTAKKENGKTRTLNDSGGRNREGA